MNLEKWLILLCSKNLFVHADRGPDDIGGDRVGPVLPERSQPPNGRRAGAVRRVHNTTDAVGTGKVCAQTRWVNFKFKVSLTPLPLLYALRMKNKEKV